MPSRQMRSRLLYDVLVSDVVWRASHRRLSKPPTSEFRLRKIIDKTDSE